MTAEPKLEPCPFCKNQPRLEKDVQCGWDIICSNGDHLPIRLWAIDKATVIQSWNTRDGVIPMLKYEVPVTFGSGEAISWLSLLGPKFPCQIIIGGDIVTDIQDQEAFDNFLIGLEIGDESND